MRPSTLSPPRAWLSGHTDVSGKAGPQSRFKGAPLPLSSEAIATAGMFHRTVISMLAKGVNVVAGKFAGMAVKS